MAKAQTTTTEAADAPVAISLDEFCIRLSRTEPRVELISGFHHTEELAGRVRDIAASYQDRFNKFMKKPM